MKDVNGTVWKKDDIKELYDLFNSRYFRNTLPDCKLDFATHKSIGAIGLFSIKDFYHKGSNTVSDRKYTIKISNNIRWSRALWAFTLLHEMAHFKLYLRLLRAGQEHRWNRQTGHGPVFQKEMKRLASMGAFVGLW